MSPLARALVAFGPLQAAPYVATLLDGVAADDRYYGTLVAVDLATPSLVGPMAELLFDEYEAVRDVALLGLEELFRLGPSEVNGAIRRVCEGLRRAILDRDELDPAVYHNLSDTVGAHVELLHRYVRLRKNALGFDEVHLYDLYIPLVENVEASVPFDEARKWAALIDGSRLVPLDTANHLMRPDEPAWAQLLTEIDRFLAEE